MEGLLFLRVYPPDGFRFIFIPDRNPSHEFPVSDGNPSSNMNDIILWPHRQTDITKTLSQVPNWLVVNRTSRRRDFTQDFRLYFSGKLYLSQSATLHQCYGSLAHTNHNRNHTSARGHGTGGKWGQVPHHFFKSEKSALSSGLKCPFFWIKVPFLLG
jgi:hypothetical protein